MRHRKDKTQISRGADHKKALERNLITQLLLFGSIQTTLRKAKFIQPKVERILKNVKKYDKVNAIRYLNKIVTTKNASQKVIDVYLDKYKDMHSGFTKIYKLKYRAGDNALLVKIQLT